MPKALTTASKLAVSNARFSASPSRNSIRKQRRDGADRDLAGKCIVIAGLGAPALLLKFLKARCVRYSALRHGVVSHLEQSEQPIVYAHTTSGHAAGRAAEQRDELAPPHSITSSARASSVGGTSMPSALAVCRLITNSNLVACNTGRSAGCAPLRT